MLGQTLQSLEVRLGQTVVLEVMRLLWTQEAYECHPYGPEITIIIVVVGDGFPANGLAVRGCGSTYTTSMPNSFDCIVLYK